MRKVIILNKLKNERLILDIIKYGPIFFVLTVSIIITQVVLIDKEKNFNNEIKLIEETFLNTNKKRINEETQEVYNFIKTEKNKSEELLKQNIKNRVYEAHNIANNIYLNESRYDIDGHTHSKDHIFQTVKNALGGIIYNNGRGYFFIDDINGTKLLQPLNKSFEGKNLLEYEDAKGYKFVKKIVHTIKSKSEAFDSYYWYKAGDKENAYKKISFYKYFEPFNIAIGTGEYVNDFENEIKEKLLEKIRNIRYGNNGYIFVYDLEGNCLSHYKKELIGKNRIDYKNKNGEYLVKNIINYAKGNKEGFISYNSSIKPIKEIDTSSKMSYVKLFKNWGWVIGTGFYLDSLHQEIENRKNKLAESKEESIKNIIYISIILTLLFIVFSFFVSKYIESIFTNYKKSLQKEVDTTIEQEKILVQQSKMATMGEMIGNIAHQWKQPLSLISTSNGLLRMNKEFESFSEKQVSEAMNHIDASVQNLSQTIDDFRNFFDPIKDKNEFFISHAFEKTFKLIDSQFKNNEIEVIKNIDIIKVTTFENELLQVLINILKNAKEELLKLEDKRLIFIDVLTEDNNLVIKIKDNAGGVPHNIINKIFDSHFTTKKEVGGTGIGLYMSKQIIEGNMKGKIDVKNEEYIYEGNKYIGAEFTIKIPLI